MSMMTPATINPQALIESRLQLHYAVQYIAATAAALAEPLPDNSHTSFRWNPALKVFVGSMIPATQPFQVALEPVSLTLIVVDDQNDAIASLPLHGKTMREGLEWLQQEVSKLGADASKIVFLDYPPNDFPDHPLAHGAAFDASQALALRELADYYITTDRLLQAIATTNKNASAIHIWPHHLDIAMLITLPGTKNGHPLTIGIGLSPGDTSYPEPYWYVYPYPYPDTANLPILDGQAFWHTQHWVGAVLQSSQLTENANAETRQQQIAAFLHSALNASITLLKQNVS
ncbi:hypothetical protein H6F86_04100 [Phormidium sp. FACHB-592]|uniref:Uncharacterized protein n=1 Tax=Stenomitos frigidus AS-A4 TaxID=2933935 RepID=A0ABV0KVL4_9CYAN|nr:hypothetical protein [Phormidium sp. FACHB-592]MBD2073082.1 hypothetical protein [Phormidium sp. FACHB-592]